MSSWSPPTADAQVAFLLNLQRLLAEGSFVATYKFALLHALADVALVKGDDSGAPLTLSTTDISARVAELYWTQASPHAGGSHVHELVSDGGAAEVIRQIRQNAGDKQAAILTSVSRSGALGGAALARFRRERLGWRRLVAEVDAVVRKMPLWKLQTVGAERLEFLYDNDPDEAARVITLKPGVAWCLRAYHGLVTSLVRGSWLRFVRRQNPGLEPGAVDLASFLFGNERASLTAYIAPLMDVQRGQCFYCGGRVRGELAVDHFVPWCRYPADLGHNLVVAHRGCNADKSDLLGAERHLERWVERNGLHGESMAQAFADAELSHDLGASHGVARWAYAQTARSNGQVWTFGRDMEHLSGEWRGLLLAS